MDFKGFLKLTKAKLGLFLILFVVIFYIITINLVINCTAMRPMLGENFQWNAICLFGPFLMLAQLFFGLQIQATVVLIGVIIFSYLLACTIIYWRNSHKKPTVPMKKLTQQ